MVCRQEDSTAALTHTTQASSAAGAATCFPGVSMCTSTPVGEVAQSRVSGYSRMCHWLCLLSVIALGFKRGVPTCTEVMRRMDGIIVVPLSKV